MGELPNRVHTGHFRGQWFLDFLSVERSVSCSIMYDSLRPRGLYNPPGSSVHGILQARELGGHFLLQGLFLTPETEARSPALQADFFTH